MSEVVSFLKPDPEACVCGCGLVGALRTKTWRDGTRHVKRCACPRCSGGRQRPRSRVRENRIAKDTGGTREPLSGGLSGIDGKAALWVWEETAEVAVVRGLRSWWQGRGVQKKVARLLAHDGARAFIASWDGKPQLVVMPYADWAGQVRDDDAFRGDRARTKETPK